MTRLTALEIITNPRDIHIIVGEKDSKFGFAIMRGPGHGYKLLLDTDGHPFETKQTAIECISSLLKAAWDDTSKQLVDPKSPTGSIVNADQLSLTEMCLLNPGCFSKITESLTATGVVNTWELFIKDDPLLRPTAEAA